MDAQMKKGLLEACVLSAIRQQESYGYKIISELSPYIKISESTLYPILRRLEGMGAVVTHSTPHNGRLRKYFKITNIGLERINAFIDDMEEFLKVSRFIIRSTDEKKGESYDL